MTILYTDLDNIPLKFYRRMIYGKDKLGRKRLRWLISEKEVVDSIGQVDLEAPVA